MAMIKQIQYMAQYELWRKWVEVDFDTKDVSWNEI